MMTKGIYDLLAGDGVLVGLLAEYNGGSAIFTTDPAPGDAVKPYIVSAGNVSASPSDTKTSIGQVVLRDIRCYTAATGSAILVEQIADRVRELVHRQPVQEAGWDWIISDASGPVAVDEQDAYGRIISVRMTMIQNQNEGGS